MRKQALDRQVRDAKQASDRHARDLRSMLRRQADDARRSIDQAKRSSRTGDSGSGAQAGAGGSWGSLFGSGDGKPSQSLDDALMVWALPVAAIAALPLAVGHLAALLTTGSWPRYHLRDAPGIMGRLPTNLGDPGKAWEPVNTGAAVPGAVGFWATFAFVALVAGLVGVLVWAMVRPPARRSSQWAAPAELQSLWVRRKDDARLVLGTSGAHRIGVRDRHSVLVVGPAHSGKSSGLTVPAVLDWRGPVLVASTKGHVIDETIGWRSRQGDVHVYDPAAITPYYRSGWSVLSDCTTWQGSIRTAADLTLAARAVVGASRDGDGVAVEGRGDLWRSSMAMALAPYLFAAVSSGRSIGVAAEWIEREEREEVLDILEGVDRIAARAHATTFMRDDSSRSEFLHAMHQILSVYEDPIVADSMDRHEIVPDELLDGGNHTLYLTTPEYDQARFRPLCALIVRRVLATAYEQSAQLGGPLRTPLLVVLDDVLGIAPIYDLASLASTAPARGVQLISVFQDVDQVAAHYGDSSDLVISSHGAKVVFATRPDPGAGRTGSPRTGGRRRARTAPRRAPLRHQPAGEDRHATVVPQQAAAPPGRNTPGRRPVDRTGTGDGCAPRERAGVRVAHPQPGQRRRPDPGLDHPARHARARVRRGLRLARRRHGTAERHAHARVPLAGRGQLSVTPRRTRP